MKEDKNAYSKMLVKKIIKQTTLIKKPTCSRVTSISLTTMLRLSSISSFYLINTFYKSKNDKVMQTSNSQKKKKVIKLKQNRI